MTIPVFFFGSKGYDCHSGNFCRNVFDLICLKANHLYRYYLLPAIDLPRQSLF